MVFETETDTAGHFNARQADGANYRLWEPAGTAHADFYDFSYFALNQATQEPSYPATTCTFTPNLANQKYVMNAALDALGTGSTAARRRRTRRRRSRSCERDPAQCIRHRARRHPTPGDGRADRDAPRNGQHGLGILRPLRPHDPAPGSDRLPEPLGLRRGSTRPRPTRCRRAASSCRSTPPRRSPTAQTSSVGIACGNGEPESGEACDDGNTTRRRRLLGDVHDRDRLDLHRRARRCARRSAATADRAAASSATTATPTPATAAPRPARVEPGFSCIGSPSACARICGDGLVVGGEGCDDGNVGARRRLLARRARSRPAGPARASRRSARRSAATA